MQPSLARRLLLSPVELLLLGSLGEGILEGLLDLLQPLPGTPISRR